VRSWLAPERPHPLAALTGRSLGSVVGEPSFIHSFLPGARWPCLTAVAASSSTPAAQSPCPPSNDTLHTLLLKICG
jgi:hypothetical protein